MSVNSSLLPSALFSSYSFYNDLYNCLNTTVGTFNITAITVTSVLLLLPLYILVLCLGLQRWRQQRSGTTMSHSDLFTYHMVIIELISVLGFAISCCGVHTDHPLVMMVGIYLSVMNLTGQMIFHILTCVVRYLAVVHPVTYRSLKDARGIRIKYISIGCAWLLCFAGIGLLSVTNKVCIKIFTYCYLVFSFTVVAFCCLSVLYVLIRPGPGDGGGGRQRADKSKLRAFYTIMIILGVLVFRLGGNIIITVLYNLVELEADEMCAMLTSVLWFCLTSSPVLPLLFLQRAGKLLCCKSNN